MELKEEFFMKQSTLSRWLKFIIIGVGLCGLVVYGMVIPILGRTIAVYEQGYYDYCYWPWLIFMVHSDSVLLGLVLCLEDCK